MIARSVPVLLALALALAGGCGGDARETRSCGGGAASKLGVWPEHQGRVGAAFELVHARPGAGWRLVVVHEGHVAWRGRAQTDGRGALKVVRRMGDYPGADRIAVRAYGPDGATCAASARLVETEPSVVKR